jgi:Family of unknown function (DUF6962)
VLLEPAPALTDLLLGLVVLGLALGLRRVSTVHRYWRSAFWWAGFGALGGFVHHGVLVRWPAVASMSWVILSLMVVLAVSYLLAATVEEVLGPGHARTFWLLRTAGLVAYASIALSGHAGVSAILACESLTMAAVLALWGWAASRHHPLAGPVLLAILVSGVAAGSRALSPSVTGHVNLDPTSIYHLAQIAGMVLLYRAIVAPRQAPVQRREEHREEHVGQRLS